MYNDTPRDKIGTVYAEQLMFGDNPLGWETARHEGDQSRRRSREMPLSITSITAHTPQRMVVGVSGMVGDGLVPMLENALGGLSGNGSGSPAPAELDSHAWRRTSRIHHKDADQAHICFGVPSYPSTPTATRSSCSRSCSVPGCRRASSSRSANAAALPTTSTARTTPALPDAGSLLSQAGVDIERIDDAITVIKEQFELMASEPVPADELEKARAFAKGRFVLGTERARQGSYGVRPPAGEVLEGLIDWFEEMLAELDAVTAEDIQQRRRRI